MTILGHDIIALVKKTATETLEDNILGLSAETAYNFFFGIFPALLFAAPILSLFGNREEIFNGIFAQLAPNIPPQALALLQQVLHDVVFTKNAPGLISIGALLSLWAGAGMFSSLMGALNAAYEVQDSRPWWKQKVIAIVFTLISIVIMGSSTAVLVAGKYIVDAVTHALQLGVIGATVWTVAQYLIAFTLAVLFIWLMYVILPDLHVPKRSAIPGAVFATIFWVIFTYLFRLYVTNFGSYNKTYGTIGAVIVLLTWMYWTMFAILVGGELNSEIHAGTGAVTGPDRVLRSHRVATREGLPHPSAKLR